MKLPKLSLKIDFSKLTNGKFGRFFSVLQVLSIASSREPSLARFVLLISFTSIFSVGGVVYFLKRQLYNAEQSKKSIVHTEGRIEEYEAVDEDEGGGEEASAENEHHEEGGAEVHEAAAEHGEGHGTKEEEVFESNPLPEEILKRQNGIPAAGYDLKEPETGLLRELASKKNSDLEVRVGNYFVDLDKIYSNARVGNKAEGALVVELTLELNSYEGREEANARKAELRAIVNSVLFEFQKDELLDYEGKMNLKRKIQIEINKQLKTAKVLDVLLSEIHMRP